MTRRATIGQLREKIEIYHIADNPFGTVSVKRTLTLVSSPWARVIDYTGVAVRSDRGLSEEITHRFIIREKHVVDTDHIIHWKGNMYKVKTVQPLGAEVADPRMQFIGIDCVFDGKIDTYKDPSPEVEEEEP